MTESIEPTGQQKLESKRVTLSILSGLLRILTAIGVAACVVLVVLVSNHLNNNSDRLVDCTTPGGECYEQSRSATTGAVGTINKVTVLAVACAKSPTNTTLHKIQQCVLDGLK